MRVEWHETKRQQNLRDHGVDFVTAAAVLDDDFALTREDPDATGEQRLVTVGLDAASALTTVVYTYRGDNIRLISARRASRKEQADYERNRY